MSARQQTASRSTMGSSNTADRSRRSFQEAIPMAPVVNSADPASALGTTASKQSSASAAAADPVIFSDSEREQKKGGPMSWIRGKVQERRAKEAEKRAKTPERGRGRSESKTYLGVKQRSPAPVPAGAVGTAEAMPVRGKSMEVQRAAAAAQGQGRGLGQGGSQPDSVAEQAMAGPVPAKQPAASRMSGIAQAPLGQSPATSSLTDGQAPALRDQTRQSLTGPLSMGQTSAVTPAAPTAPTTTPLVPPTAEAYRPLDGQGAADGQPRIP
ncbi:GTPase activating protein (GAP) for Rho1p [Friedmanniomyces endolithicus]|nr:GTPase activating protein (GAP) for Rho1p [Friedmanniomyces endolithicus]